MLQGGIASIGGKSIEKNHFKQRSHVREETKEMVSQLRRQLVAQRASLTELTGQLVRSSTKMT